VVPESGQSRRGIGFVSDRGRPRSAGVVVQVFPLSPGEVLLEVGNLGPTDLSHAEMIYTLRRAADLLEAGPPEGRSES
jgi:hypothetical protein